MPPKLSRSKTMPANVGKETKVNPPKPSSVSARKAKASVRKVTKKTTKKSGKEAMDDCDTIEEENETDLAVKGEVKKVYTKLSDVEHVLKRCELYIGSKVLKETDELVVDESFTLINKKVTTSVAMCRIFIEALSNAMDNIINSRIAGIQCSKLKVEVDKETGLTTVINDGDYVPIKRTTTPAVTKIVDGETIIVEKEHKSNTYNHSMIFGEMRSGQNYDDNIARATSGLNGVGIKCTNIFSTQFTVEGCDPVKGKILKQTWTHNMKQTKGPKIKKSKLKNGYTIVSWVPDFKEFGLSGYTDDIIGMYRKYVVDAAMVFGLRTSFNDVVIPKPTLKNYALLYTPVYKEQLYIQTDDCKVLITPSTEFTVVSFVNGLFTKNGGVHVTPWVEALMRPILERINKKYKTDKNGSAITIRDLKNYFRIFIVATVVGPKFDNQEKSTLTSPTITALVTPKHINYVCKWPFMESIKSLITSKSVNILKKCESSRKVKISGLDHANKAGTAKSSECSLILCEGLSAKTYAIAGLKQGINGKTGRDWFGVMALRGKFLNVRKASAKSIAENKVIVSLIKAMGLRSDVDYTDEKNYKTLRYGQVVILCDADQDGVHIESLIINFFQSMFPSLLRRETPFIISMKTPIVRVFGNGKSGDMLFFDENRFANYAKTHTFSKKPKYYKGLGTTKKEDVSETFGLKMVNYIMDSNAESCLIKNFSDVSSGRKSDILKYDPNAPSFSLDDQGTVCDMSVSQFLDCELIKYSFGNCKTKLPNIIDGLKECQRKIIYAVKKRGLGYNGPSLKVAQLGGYVAEHTNYHHGEDNLYNTIIKLASDYVDSNNIPLLYRDGMFGTRLENGKDSASPRYIYTKMDYMTESIYMKEDDSLLDYVMDDGDVVEPSFYVPIIPMILVNRTFGIATGFSSTIPLYNPLDIVNILRVWIRNLELLEDEKLELPELFPWYRNFKGTINKESSSKYTTQGVVHKDGKVYTVTELPIGSSVNDYKEYMETLVEQKKIKSFNNHSTPTEVNFEVISSSEDNDLMNDLNLTSCIATTNMVCIDHTMKISHYSIDEIITQFCNVRYSFYTLRRQALIDKILRDIKLLENKIRFITDVNSDVISLKTKRSILVDAITNLGYDKDSDSFDYLLQMTAVSFTSDKIVKLKANLPLLQIKLAETEMLKESNMWLNDLDRFVSEYDKWIVDVPKDESTETKGRGGRGGRGRGRRGKK